MLSICHIDCDTSCMYYKPMVLTCDVIQNISLKCHCLYLLELLSSIFIASYLKNKDTRLILKCSLIYANDVMRKQGKAV